MIFKVCETDPLMGDLHDGNGLSDAALPNGVFSNPIFDEIDYDLLTIGKFCFLSAGCWFFGSLSTRKPRIIPHRHRL